MNQSVMTRHAVSNPESSTTIVGLLVSGFIVVRTGISSGEREEGVHEERGGQRKGTSISATTSVTIS